VAERALPDLVSRIKVDTSALGRAQAAARAMGTEITRSTKDAASALALVGTHSTAAGTALKETGGHAQTAAGGLRATAASAKEAGEASRTTTGHMTALTGSLNAVHQSSTRVTGALGSIASTALGFGVATAGANLLGGAMGFLQNATVGMNASLETSTLQFKSLGLSGAEAKQHVQDLFEFAKATPFETRPIINASRQLEVFGGRALDTTANLKLFGDTAAATNAPLEQVTFWIGRLYAAAKTGRPFGEALQNLQELGVISPEATAKLEALSSSGAKLDQVWPILTGDLQRFNGAMQAQAGTWQGLTSTISDAINITSSTVLRPFFREAEEGLKHLADLLGSDQVKAGAEKLALNIKAGFDSAIGAIQRFWQTFGPALKAAADFINDHLVPVLTGLPSDIKAVIDEFNRLPEPIRAVISPASELAAHFGDIQDALGKLSKAIQDFSRLGGVGTDPTAVIRVGLKDLGVSASDADTASKPLAGTWTTLAYIWKDLSDNVLPKFNSELKEFTKGLNDNQAAVKGVQKDLDLLGINGKAALLGLGVGFILLSPLITGAITAFGLLGAAITLLEPIVRRLGQIVGEVMFLILNYVTTYLEAARTFIQTWANFIAAVFRFWGDFLVGEIRIVTDLILGRWTQAWTDVKNTALILWADIQRGAGGLAGGLSATFWAIADGAGRAMYSLAGNMAGGLNQALGAVNRFISLVDAALGPFGVHVGQVGYIAAPNVGINVQPHAEGGIFSNPHLGLVGEGGPEAIIPLGGGGGSRAVNLWRQAGQALGICTDCMGRGASGLGAGCLQCLEWVSNVTGLFRGVPAAKDLVPYINSSHPAPGEIFVSTLGAWGHTGFVTGPNRVRDANWVPCTVADHALSDIPYIAGYINLGDKILAGLAGALGGLFDIRGMITPFINQALGGLGGWPGTVARGVMLQAVEGIVRRFDDGGTLSPGLNMVYNGLGHPERLRPEDSGWGGGYNITFNISGVSDPEMVAAAVDARLSKYITQT
jgi:hypothetical protein